MPVADAAKRMQAANSDAALVCERVGTEWKVRGILTDTDVMRKVVAAGRDPDAVTVDTVMTRNPQVVAAGSTAESALCTMIENRFRHLPVVGATGVVGVLDIAKCLGDALGRMQNHQLGHALSLQARVRLRVRLRVRVRVRVSVTVTVTVTVRVRVRVSILAAG